MGHGEAVEEGHAVKQVVERGCPHLEDARPIPEQRPLQPVRDRACRHT